MSSQIYFYDTCVRIGRSRAPVPPGRFMSAGDLAAMMERHNIVKAAVEHAVAMEYGPREGQEMLAAEIAAFNNMRPALHLMPDLTPRIEKAWNDPEEILETGAVLARVDAQDFCQGRGDQACFAPVLEACQEIALPVILDFRRQGNAATFDFDICRRWPGIPFILEGISGYPLHRTTWVLREYENCYLSTVGRTEFNALGLYDELGLVERLVYGSNWPVQSAGMAQGVVAFGDVDDEKKQAVASGTFLKLVESIGRKSS